MSFSGKGHRIAVVAIVATAWLTTPAGAQESGSGPQSMRPMGESVEEAAMERPYEWNISFGVGRALGSNPVGSFTDVQDATVFTYDIDSGVFISGRAARRLWWRLGAEVEFGYGNPGVNQTTTNRQGADVNTEAFGDYSFALLGISARLDLADARVTPFLLGGLAVTFHGYPDGESSSAPGFGFGGGLDVRIVDQINLRADVRGLRANIDDALLSRGVLERIEEEDQGALVTQLLWTIGLSVRF